MVDPVVNFCGALLTGTHHIVSHTKADTRQVFLCFSTSLHSVSFV